MANGLEINALTALTQNAPKPVLNAIKAASQKSGVNFAYLVQQAKAESNFDADVKAKTSSATGLYQFINATWMSMIERYGDKHGIDTEGKTKQEILDLRKDPVIASHMAAEFAGENERYLDKRWGGEVGSTELYFAHFLGAPKAAAFLNAKDDNGHQPAAVIFPKAAKANYNVFYERGTGRAKSVNEVYAFFDKKFDIKDVGPEALAGDIGGDIANDVPKPGMKPDLDAATNPGSLYDHKRPDSLIFNAKPSNIRSPLPYFQLVQSPVELMLLSQLDLPTDDKNKSIF